MPELFFFFQAEDGIRDFHVTGVQTCALPIYAGAGNDTLTGGSGPDVFYLSSTSGSAADVNGGPGADTFILSGTPGTAATITGGGGNDTLVEANIAKDRKSVV